MVRDIGVAGERGRRFVPKQFFLAQFRKIPCGIICRRADRILRIEPQIEKRLG